jgi:glycosyltransferase involved in cell wall biosynthesis
MRILFLSHYFPPEVNAPATRTFDHCVRWARAGNEVTVVTCAPNCPLGVVRAGYRNRIRPQVEIVKGVRVVRVWTYLAPNAGTVRRTVNYLSYLASASWTCIRLPRPDVVVATSPQFFCGWAGVLVSWLKRAPLVLEIRDIWPESIKAVGAIRSRLLLRILGAMERAMYRCADHIVVVGEGYRRKVLEKADVADRLSIVTNGVDLPNDRPYPLPEIPDPDGRFICTYVGTLGMAHGLEVVLKAARILKRKGRSDIRFYLVGDGAAREQLQRQAAQDGLNGLVVFTGQRPSDDIPAILARSQACLIHLKKCRLFEGVIPSKIFETMAMGRPIIMGVRGEAREIVMQADAGVAMEPESPQSLVQAVEKLADDPQAASRLGRSARAHVARRYNRDLLAARFLRLLQNVAGVDSPDGGSRVPLENV